MSDLLTKDEVSRFLNAARSRLGCDYVWPNQENNWSGKDLKIAKYQKVYDCSGLVTSSLYEATGGKIDKRASWNAQSLLDNCALVTVPKPGDLCFYGLSPKFITHVGIYMGEKNKEGQSLDSCGGTPQCTTPEIAKKTGAKVMFHKSPKYRADFQCFGRLATLD